jgi:RimJ/RimL family protein N-acetyltransferase
VLRSHWPLFGLTLQTARLTLHLPSESELAALADVAAAGVHRPTERPFLTPWTEGGPESRARNVLQGYWGQLAAWSADDWSLSLGVFRDDEPLGCVTLRARDFAVAHEVMTSSWLGLPHQGQGFGTEARTAILSLAFDHLGAECAMTEVFQDNHASQGVSRKLGYRPDGISRDVREGEVVVSDRLRLVRDDWEPARHGAVSVDGLDACRAFFGV